MRNVLKVNILMVKRTNVLITTQGLALCLKLIEREHNQLKLKGELCEFSIQVFGLGLLVYSFRVECENNLSRHH